MRACGHPCRRNGRGRGGRVVGAGQRRRVVGGRACLSGCRGRRVEATGALGVFPAHGRRHHAQGGQTGSGGGVGRATWQGVAASSQAQRPLRNEGTQLTLVMQAMAEGKRAVAAREGTDCIRRGRTLRPRRDAVGSGNPPWSRGPVWGLMRQALHTKAEWLLRYGSAGHPLQLRPKRAPNIDAGANDRRPSRCSVHQRRFFAAFRWGLESPIKTDSWWKLDGFSITSPCLGVVTVVARMIGSHRARQYW